MTLKQILTFLCAPYESWKKFKSNNGTIATLYKKFKEGKTLSTKRFIWRTPIGYDVFTKIKGLDLLPCDIDLLGEDLVGAYPQFSSTLAENPFRALQKHSKQTLREWLFLKDALFEVENSYDYILIDCLPNLYMMTQNALVASDCYIITAIPEYLSLIGLHILERKIKQIGKKVTDVANLAGREDINIAELGGVIFVKVRIGGSLITKQHYGNIDKIKEDLYFARFCFEDYTTELIGYSEAAERRLPVWLANTSNTRNAAKKREYEKITNEFLGRFK